MSQSSRVYLPQNSQYITLRNKHNYWNKQLEKNCNLDRAPFCAFLLSINITLIKNICILLQTTTEDNSYSSSNIHTHASGARYRYEVLKVFISLSINNLLTLKPFEGKLGPKLAG